MGASMMIARRIHWLQDHLPRAARRPGRQSNSLPLPVSRPSVPSALHRLAVTSTLPNQPRFVPSRAACLPWSRCPGALPTWALGAQGPVYAWVEIEARLWGRRAARASIVPACYDYRGAMSTLDASTRARVGAPWGSSWNRTPAFDGKAGPWALGLGGSPVLDETVGNVGEIFWNCSWAC